MPTWPQPSLSSGFTYVQDTQPDGPAEGETWYDLGGNEAKVYDGAQWHLLTVTDHSEIGGVSAGQHRSDSNIRSTVDGAVDADTVDGKHASDFAGLALDPSKIDSVSNSANTSVECSVSATGPGVLLSGNTSHGVADLDLDGVAVNSFAYTPLYFENEVYLRTASISNSDLSVTLRYVKE